MKKKILALFLLTLVWIAVKGQSPMYQVKKIKSVHKHYIIYVISADSMSKYQVVSKKEKVKNGMVIKKNKSYPFKLAKVQILGGPEVNCVSLDEKTVICREPYYELALASNLKGLCIIE